MRAAAFPILAAAWLLAGAAYAQDAAPEPGPVAAAVAAGPLVLRIRPRDEAPEDGTGIADAAREAEAARLGDLARAVAAREAFEARITARANRAIASVYTGCLAPMPPPSLPSRPAPAAQAAPVPAALAMTGP